MKTKQLFLQAILFCFPFLLLSQIDKPILISTRLGLNTFVEANLYADIPLDEKKGLAFGIGFNPIWSYEQSICGMISSRQLSQFFLKEGFKLKAGLNFYSTPFKTRTLMLDYRYGIVRDLLVNNSCESSIFDRSDRVDFRTHQIGLMYYYDKNLFWKTVNFFYGVGAAISFAEQTILTDNNRIDSDIYGVFRFDIGFRINIKIPK
jgi:hypothetical protein